MTSAVEDRADLLKIVSKFVQLTAPISACKSGCSHCCKMAVTITSDEAASIGEAIGVVPLRPPPVVDQEATVAKHMNTVCPFLKSNVCSIYEHRPVACRLHFNISAYPVVCDTINFPGNDVPNYNFEDLWFAVGAVSYLSGAYPADIRDFFPDGLDVIPSL